MNSTYPTNTIEAVRGRLAEMERSQAWLARQLGVGPATVTGWMLGRCKPMGPARRLIEQLLGVPVSTWDQPTNAPAANSPRAA